MGSSIPHSPGQVAVLSEEAQSPPARNQKQRRLLVPGPRHRLRQVDFRVSLGPLCNSEVVVVWVHLLGRFLARN